MNKTISALLASTLVAACSQTTAAPPSTADINDQLAFSMARAAVLANLKDGDSAKFGTTFARKTVGEGATTAALRFMAYTVDQRTDLVCGTVNAKNSFGGYVGMQVFAYRVGRQDVFLDEGIGGKRLGSMWCVDMEAVR